MFRRLTSFRVRSTESAGGHFGGSTRLHRAGCLTRACVADPRVSACGVYPALPPGDKYELVLHEAEHGAFGERVILALSTAFWDAFLKGDAEAKAWLNGEAPRSVLEKDDRWQRK